MLIFKRAKNTKNASQPSQNSGHDNQDLITRHLIVENHKKSDNIIKALHVEVRKTAHKDSYINAEHAMINRHEGLIEGGDIEINHLKGGKIVANTVRINFLESGEVEANYVYIKRLGSKSVIIANDTIEIDKVEGTKNNLIIKPLIDIAQLDKLSKLCDKISLFRREFREINKILKDKRVDIGSQIKRIDGDRAKIKVLREQGEIPDTGLMAGVKEFDIFSREYEKLTNMLSNLENNIKKDEQDFFYMYGDFFFGGKVISNSLWKEGNNITFCLPKYELEYTTGKCENAHEIYLRYNAERENQLSNEFEIDIKKKEYK